ncbi:MAG TPA: PHP domain-containing protein [Thermofilaceae archaeon]|nr:PHP domain-containing protein [Thermofilaceae archaeon]
MLPRIDLHIHSQFSPCAVDVSVLEDARVAVERGLRVIAVTDHGTERKPSWLSSYFEALEEAREVYGDELVLLSGIEVDIGPEGRLVVERRILEELEVVIASIHRIPVGARVDKYWRRCMLEAVRSGVVAVLGHPTDIGWRKVELPEDYVLEVLDEAVSSGVAIEVNYHHRDPEPYFLELAIKRGVKLIPASDAHRLSEIGLLSWHESFTASLSYAGRARWMSEAEAISLRAPL